MILNALFNVCYLILFARVIFSWIPYETVGYDNIFRRMAYDLTEPFLRPIRQSLPMAGPLDFSVIILYFILYFLQSMLYSII
ncbi:MAG TPA: YggT family protein [Anaerolineae bacterium]|nr:YggT family protein [Anaerolineae bacterium]